MKTFINLNSLRNRYAIAAVALSMLVVLAAVSANYLLTDTRVVTAKNIDQRHMLLTRSRVIRNTVWQAREALGQFLVDPYRVKNQEQIHESISQALANTQRVIEDRNILDRDEYQRILQLEQLLQELDEAASVLILIRLDPTKQYPSLVLARDQLLPRQQAILNAFNSALHEIDYAEDTTQASDTVDVYRLLVDARHRWVMTISGVRMYIASRVGNFAGESLAKQELDIHIQYENFLQKISRLQQLGQAENANFIIDISVNEIAETAQSWHKQFELLKEIHTSEYWRSDIIQLREKIDPLLKKIWSLLLYFDSSLSTAAEKDVNTLLELAENQSTMIWLITIFSLIFIVVGYFSFDTLVLRPMSMLAKAFHDEAKGGQNITLPIAHSTETQNLIDAFAEMRHQVRSRQQALEYQTLHDSLTGLANRSLLFDRLNQAIANSKRQHAFVSLIMMDLDRFKEVNDTLGHQIGDKLLIEVSIRLKHILREVDTVSRLGGDEFAILLNHTDETEARNACKKILQCFEEAFAVERHNLYVGASLGIAVYPQHGRTAQTLLKRADVAMFVAKRNRIGYTFYDASNDDYDQRYLSLGNDMRAALNQDNLEVHYQVKYDISSNEAIGVEALLRWKHPEFGWIPPASMIPLAEQLGIIERLTLYVLQNAIAQCAMWRDQGLFLNVAVNLSVYNLQSADLVECVSNLLQEYDVPTSYLTIEITESAMLIDPNSAIEVLQRLDNIGIRIAIDDFGTGFSSLGYLKQLPVDELKIDKSFVMDMTHDENDAVIVRSTIDLAHNLGLNVVAEGVENREILQLLNMLKCDMAQGFYFSEALPGTEIEHLLNAENNKMPVNLIEA